MIPNALRALQAQLSMETSAVSITNIMILALQNARIAPLWTVDVKLVLMLVYVVHVPQDISHLDNIAVKTMNIGISPVVLKVVLPVQLYTQIAKNVQMPILVTSVPQA